MLAGQWSVFGCVGNYDISARGYIANLMALKNRGI
jgi:hypothetical protein